MREFYERLETVDVLESEYIRLLGYPRGRALEGRGRDLADQTRSWYERFGTPWVYGREVERFEPEDGPFRLDGRVFDSPRLSRMFRETRAETVAVLAASAGKACVERAAELWQEGKPDEYFFMEVYAGAVVERLVAEATHRICGWADGMGRIGLPHYSPGYSEWDVSQQEALWEVIASGVGSAGIGELSVLPSGMLTPKKSLLGVVGMAPRGEAAARLSAVSACETCALPACTYRRRPYHLDTETERPSDLGSAVDASEGGEGMASAEPLRADASYSIGRKALQKWSQSRLALERGQAGGYEAVFTYDGTTCSNMGHPLRYLYRITVGSRERGFPILDLACGPVAEDEGHGKQCAYLKDRDGLNRAVREERPLMGERLDAVLDWEPGYSAAGCLCEADARARKWKIAFEALHYTLAERERAVKAASAALVEELEA